MNSLLYLLPLSLLLIATSKAPAPDPPTTEPIVETLVESHAGWVGGLIVDSLGYVYIADFQETVWRLDPNTRKVEKWASGFYGASGIALDRHGNLYQANYWGHFVNKISRDGEVSVAVSEDLSGPVGLVFGEAGELFVCSCNDNTIRRADADGRVTNFAASEHFRCPNGITRDGDGNLYVVSFNAPKVVKISPDGETSVLADSGGAGLGHIAQLRGLFYATSYRDNKVYRFSRDGEIELFAGTGERAQRDGPGASAQFSNPNGIYADGTGTYLYINDYIGPTNASGTATTPYSIRRIEVPSLARILEHELRHGSIDGARTKHRSFRSNPIGASEDWRVPIDRLGTKLMGEELDAEARALFELNAETYADWWKAHSSLGAVLTKVGDNRAASSALRRALELNPEAPGVAERLEELDGG